jgi:hypothetical protein
MQFTKLLDEESSIKKSSDSPKSALKLFITTLKKKKINHMSQETQKFFISIVDSFFEIISKAGVDAHKAVTPKELIETIREEAHFKYVDDMNQLSRLARCRQDNKQISTEHKASYDERAMSIPFLHTGILLELIMKTRKKLMKGDYDFIYQSDVNYGISQMTNDDESDLDGDDEYVEDINGEDTDDEDNDISPMTGDDRSPAVKRAGTGDESPTKKRK